MKTHAPTLIKLPYLVLLDLTSAHLDYVEQFLCDKVTYLPSLLDLCIKYELLTTVTNNFTNESMRRHCGQLKRLHASSTIHVDKLHHYFPLL
ncbi:unnamed protein product [Adineta ricciae]|uniref:Uncharacterized protein n=1 Tax=Adineta ricciae TaxID=249248 RepID=A0A815UZG2_ADIRI|nr:unnamed protein product [Adineta ricciae]